MIDQNKIIKYQIYYGERLSTILEIIKQNGCEIENVHIETEVDYGGCYYEGDSPDTLVYLIMKIPKTSEEIEKEELKLKKLVDNIKMKPKRKRATK